VSPSPSKERGRGYVREASPLFDPPLPFTPSKEGGYVRGAKPFFNSSLVFVPEQGVGEGVIYGGFASL